ncbi:hypothetical protein EDB19DRAFT_1996411 [Suillus lakei]|nr:hypothetical protein EDB19DRAFT_1996411 [Suillus lakei]
MPDLEQLTLELELPSTIPEDTALHDQVPLTRLRILPVDVKIAPNLTRVESLQSFSDLSSVIHKDTGGSLSVIRSLRASISLYTFGVQFSTSLTASKSVYSWNPRGNNIRLSIQAIHSNNPAIIFDMCQIVPHRKVQSLFVSSSLRIFGSQGPPSFRSSKAST